MPIMLLPILPHKQHALFQFDYFNLSYRADIPKKVNKKIQIKANYKIIFNQINKMNTSADKRTVQETAEDRKFGRTYQQYYDDSRYRSPDSKSTSSQISQTKVFDISINTLVSVINRIKQQNQFFVAQKQKLSEEMGQLSALSDMLIQQNQSLRKHYHQRSIDVQQVIRSISVNCKEQLSDLQHLIYTYQGSNTVLAKEIRLLSQRAGQIQNNILMLQRQFEGINLNNINVQKSLRMAEIKSQQSDRKLNKQNTNKTLIDLENLQKQVCELNIETFKIHKKNLSTLRYIQNERYHIESETPTLKNETIRTIQAKKQLNNQVDHIKEDCQREQNKYNTMNANNDSLLSKLANLQRENEFKSLKLSKLQNKISQLQKQKQRSVQQIRKSNDERISKIKIKQSLQKEQLAFEQTKMKNTAIFQMKKLQIQKATEKKISQLKSQIEKTNQNVRNQMTYEFIPTKSELDKTSSGLRMQVHSLQSQITELQKLLKPNKITLKNVYLSKPNQG